MKNINKILLVIAFFTIFGCQKAVMPDPLGFGNEWIGLWKNEEIFFEIYQNGYGLYNQSTGTSSETVYTGDGQTYTIEVFEPKPIIIENNKFKIGIEEFNIDEEPTDAVDDAGNSYTCIVLDGETLIKTE